jgi:hypothetical protein
MNLSKIPRQSVLKATIRDYTKALCKQIPKPMPGLCLFGGHGRPNYIKDFYVNTFISLASWPG